ncbi:sulfurtransferase [Bauldia sp.]|uniref:sulfurtransferase n=1 Tax=Bauldia sp. TaxID=2575872 RepID=UPI003BA89DC6
MTNTFLRTTLVAAVLGVATVVSPAQSADYANSHLIMSADALNAQIDDPNLVVIDVRPADAFAEGHIPGAQQLNPDAVVDTNAPIEGALLPTEDIAKLLGDRGVSADAKVVLYDDKGGFHAARMFWLMEYHGHRNVSILNGGLDAWTGAGLALAEGEAASVQPAKYAVALSPRRHATADWIMERRNDADTVVIDVRPVAMYDEGHIPWAQSIPWKGNLAEDGTMKPADELRAHFADHGISDDDNIVVHCQQGLASSHSYFALRLIGHPQVRTYHRSWAEWGATDDLPKAVSDRG